MLAWALHTSRYHVEMFWFMLTSVCAQLSVIAGVPVVQMLHHSIQSQLMEDVVINCFFTEKEGQVSVYWYYYNKEGKHEIVHVFQNGKDNQALQSSHFRGRTRLFHEEIQNGNASLWLSGVKIADAGQYRCFVKDQEGPSHDEASLEVYALYRDGMLQVTQDGDQASAVCRYSGGYPQSEITWQYEDGRTVNQTDSTHYTPTSEGLVVVQSHLSLHLEASEKICCFVGQDNQRHSTMLCRGLVEVTEDEKPLTRTHNVLLLPIILAAAVILVYICKGLLKLKKVLVIHMKKKVQSGTEDRPVIHIQVLGLPGHGTSILTNQCKIIIWSMAFSGSKGFGEKWALKGSVYISADEGLKLTQADMEKLEAKYYKPSNHRKLVQEVFVFVYSCDKNMSTEMAKLIEDFISFLKTLKDSYLVVVLTNSSSKKTDLVNFFQNLGCTFIIPIINSDTGDGTQSKNQETGVKTLLQTCLQATQFQEEIQDNNMNSCTVSLLGEE